MIFQCLHPKCSTEQYLTNQCTISILSMIRVRNEYFATAYTDNLIIIWLYNLDDMKIYKTLASSNKSISLVNMFSNGNIFMFCTQK